jgi:hypothetical protein
MARPQFRALVIVPLLAFLLSATAEQKADYKLEGNWEQICKRVEAQPVAEVQPSGPVSKTQLNTCDETAL